MDNFEFVSFSDLARKSSQFLKKAEGDKTMICVKNNTPVGFFVGMDNPIARFLSINTTDDPILQAEKIAELTLSGPWKESFAARHNGIVPTSQGNHNIDKLLGLEGSEVMSKLPAKDHYTLWERDGEPVLFTMQVYDLEMEVMYALGEFCLKYGLTYKIQSRSWYLPGVSILIVIRKK